MASCSGDGGGRWRLHLVAPLVLLWISLDRTVRGCTSINCNVVLTEAQGKFMSPCYPQNYPNSHSCRWTLQAPTGFIIQLSFLDFELEEAPGCKYDWLLVHAGNTEAKFCGLTASGMTLNSTGNVMELSFTSDFSIQKRGFSVSFQHVAVALRNQKVKISSGAGQATQVSGSVSIPALSEFTVCFEVERAGSNQKEWLFTYYDSSNNVALSLGSTQSDMKMVVDGTVCSVETIISAADFTSSMKSFCVLWKSSSGLVAVYFNRIYRETTCSPSSNHLVPAGGVFQLGGLQSFNGNMYNLRLWNRTMTLAELKALSCGVAGSVIDWDNSFWSIPSSLAQTDNTLSCSASPSDSPELGHGSSANGTITASAAPPSSNPANVSSASSTPQAEQPANITAVSSAATNHTATNATTHVSLVVSSPQTLPGTTPQPPFLTTNHLMTNISDTASSREGLFYGVFLLVESERSQQAVERALALWLNQTFQDWTFAVDHFRVDLTGGSFSYSCQLLLVIRSRSEADVMERLLSRTGLIGTGLQVQPNSLYVRLVGNCPEENLLHFLWPETRPRVTQYLPCFPNKDHSASRSCLINPENYNSFWSTANLTSCSVTAENAVGVAEQLANFTKNSLSNEEVSQVVTKVQELVNVAKIDAAVAETVVHIISNVMISSDKPPADASNKALKAVEELAHKVEFGGLSVNITSKTLALGVLALNHSTFNGTSFSAFFLPNSTDPKIEFDVTANPLAQVTLPGSLLSSVSLSDVDRSSLSRINFMFFSSTNLFQKEQNSLSLNSYVVASSVGNLSIKDLKDPVKIEISHLHGQVSSKRKCMFWDFSMNEGDGGWNARGCSVSKESSSNRTVCLCNHLTHFGILMDVSQTSSQIDQKNKKVLTFLSYIGCGVSAICCAATLLTYVAFESLRRDYPSKILMNLSTSLLFLNMVFLLDGWLASLNRNEGLCMSAAVLLHYFLLTSFTWMGLESVHMYIALVKVFNTYIRRYILKFCVVGWGLPAVLVGIVVSVNKNFYGVLKDGQDESARMCWIKDRSVFYTTCVGYFCLVFLLNVAMFIVVMMQICGRNGKRSNRTLREEVLRNLRSVVSLTFLLGMTWGFALFAWGPVYLTFTYLFTIFNSLQGLFIFVFHCALKENVQKQWRRSLCCGPYGLSYNSDVTKTATNNTKKVSSDHLGKSLSSSSFGSSSSWTCKAKATLTPFSKRLRSTDKSFSNQNNTASIFSSSSSSDTVPNSSSSSSSILPVSQMIDKVKDYCSTRTDNFYKNIILSDSFVNCTRL
ncbi:adhesion G-protein coupled receptor G6 isoform X2 [Kryptolebias marmoratus]|uniref:adhesion G-protein coupled receptor G6 isoform X2 n=1 Tax=Kryptolebias marmoratus TaxID=37003 RepID=UPI000D530667|nr:adhesion G-protein coupled receptor G6 isoform X2 [Kryptolebias marmoratus]